MLFVVTCLYQVTGVAAQSIAPRIAASSTQGGGGVLPPATPIARAKLLTDFVKAAMWSGGIGKILMGNETARWPRSAIVLGLFLLPLASANNAVSNTLRN